jgi:hypothetical protein
MKTRSLILALLLSGFGPVSLTAQSLFNAAGLGVPIEALDGRARALGNLGIGMPGASFMPTDPAAVARLTYSTATMAGQPSWVDYESEGGLSGSFQGSRFPLLGIAYPLFTGTMSVQVGSFLDQHFQAESTGSVDLVTGPVETSDSFDQDGSVSNLNFGFARMLGDDIALGITVGRYAGSVIRTFTRTFDGGDVEGLDEYVEEGQWDYKGVSVTAGVSADLGSSLRVAASVQVPSHLEAEASDDTDGEDGEFALPMQFRLGASATPAEGLMVTGSLSLADWSSTEDDITGATRAGDTNGYGVGVELSRARLFGKSLPVRFGFRRSGLPFSFDDATATERAFSGGIGLSLNSAGELVLAGADLAIERGRRSGAGITEKFWRATISVVVSSL